MSGLLVVGDAFLDRDVHGDANRLCPDAPAVVVDQRVVVERPGGAGLAAALARRNCERVRLLAPVGDDEAGRRLRQLLHGLGVELIAIGDVASTVEKTRIMVDGRPLLRLDSGTAPIGSIGWPGDADVADADSIVVADYGRGTADAPAVRAALSRLLARGVPLVWDPHPHGGAPIAGTTLVTPSRREAAAMAGALLPRRAGAHGLGTTVHDGRTLARHWRVDGVAVTMGAEGALLVRGDGAPLVVPVTEPSNGTDACGAGDAFSGACATALADGAVVSEAVEHGVRVASRFVAEGGAAGLSGVAGRPEPAAPAHVADRHRTLVASGGCFDVLHAGHVRMLQQARRLGDRLVVLINSDESVARLKGPDRPVNRANDRAAVLRALDCVDEVVVFEEDTPVQALRRIRPAVFVKGGDYSSTNLPEEPVIAEWGGTVVTVPYLAGRSTSALLGRRARQSGSLADGG